MNNWTTNYIAWVTSSPIAYAEWTASNNHGTYFYNQLASLQILVGDTNAAINTTKSYFSKQYLSQINSTGEQSLEAVRTHPYHYRCYNLAAMIVNAKIGKFLGLDFWNTNTSQGGTIQKAADFAMRQRLNTTDGDGPLEELYPSVAAVAANYGDLDGRYALFMARADNTYPAQPYFLFNQNFSDSGLAAATPTPTAIISPTASSTSGASTRYVASSRLRGSLLVGSFVMVVFSFLG